jgi:hypothetical protein
MNMPRTILLLALLLAACGPTPEAREEAQAARNAMVQTGDFDRISLTGPPDVIVTTAPAVSVRVDGDPAETAKLQIEAVAGELRIGVKPGLSLSGRHALFIHVTMPRLQGVTILGPGDVNVDRIQGQSFTGNVTGPGDLAIRHIEVGVAHFSVDGPGGIRASGTAQRVEAGLSGPGDLSLSGLRTTDATVTLTGPGDIALHATGTVQGQLTGSGNIDITGGARCTVASTGPGNVSCGADGGN